MGGLRRIYFDVQDGTPIYQIGRNGSIKIPSVEQEIESIKILNERTRNTFDVIELTFETYQQDFSEASSYRVNPETKELEFSYPDPNAPEEPQPYQAPLSVEVENLKVEDLNNKEAIADLYIMTMGV